MKKVLLGVLICLLTFAAAVVLKILLADPNFMMKRFSDSISADETREISFSYGEGIFNEKMPVFSFTPDESTEYTFEISDLTVNSESVLSMHVMDKQLTDYLDVNSVDNRSESDETTGTGKGFSGTVLLTKGEKYYVGFGIISDVESENSEEDLSGSFRLTVTRAEAETAPAEVEEGGTVKLTVSEGGQAGAVFRPESKGYYKFTSIIASKNKVSGYSSITSVTSAEKKDIKLVDGICYLEDGTDYYIWVSIYELNKGSAEVELSCKAVEFINTDNNYDFEISKETIIEYRSESEQQIAVYCESGSDSRATVYDSDGFPIASDDNSGAAFSENEKDFALVLNAQAGESYWIFISGDFETCKISIAKYTGDGTSLGPDDISPFVSDEASTPDTDETASPETDGTSDQAADEESTAEEMKTEN